MQEKRIAVFIDVDNAELNVASFDKALELISGFGSVVYGKVYGASERKHKEILNRVAEYGFDLAPVMRVKKRGSKPADLRIFVDAVDAVYSLPSVDAIAVLTGKGDLVPLFAKMRALEVSVLSLASEDEAVTRLIDEVLELEIAPQPVKYNNPRIRPQPFAPAAAEPETQEPAAAEEEKPTEQPQPAEETPAEEPRAEEPPAAGTEAPAAEAEEAQPVQTVPEESPRTGIDGNEITQQIEKVRGMMDGETSDDTAKLLDQIQKLIDEDL